MKKLLTKPQKGSASKLLHGLFLITVALVFPMVHLKASDAGSEKDEDAAITTQVKRTLLYHLSLTFKISTQEGVVTLSGSAADIAERDLNVKLAAEIKGVKSVVNNMVIPVIVARND